MSQIKDISLFYEGEKKIEFVKNHMPVLAGLEKEFIKEKPFKDTRIAISIHLEAKTAYLAKALQSGGAEVFITGSNPLSTQDDIASALLKSGMEVNAVYGADKDTYDRHILLTLKGKPHLLLDDGGDLVKALHEGQKDLAANITGGCEETTTGVNRLKKLERERRLLFPMIDVNGAYSKHLFDNRYGTGQSVWDAVMRTTNLVIAGKTVVVAGYGWCSRGIAMRARGLGARVIITEVDAVKALEAVFDGYEVTTMDEACHIGDIFITATGCAGVIKKEHFPHMKDRAIIANAGHFNVEADLGALEKMAVKKEEQKKNITGYTLENGKTIYLLAEGRLINLAGGDGHPAEIMDLSFSLQALCLRYMKEKGSGLEKKVYRVPEEIDYMVAERKLSSMGIKIDKLNRAQEEYLYGAPEGFR